MSRRNGIIFAEAGEANDFRRAGFAGPGVANDLTAIAGELNALSRPPANRHERRSRAKRLKALGHPAATSREGDTA